MKNPIKHRLSAILAAGAALLLGLQSARAQVKVACVGDSITAGYALQNPGSDSYPAQLQALLGSGYAVGNFGLSGATLQKQSDYTYWNSSQHINSLAYNPDIVVIMLGTNDSKPWNWNATNFDADYRALIAQYQGLATHPKVYICLPPPVYTPNPFGSAFSPAVIQNTVVPAVQAVATNTGVTLIDNNTPLLNHPELFTDGVHPTPQGAGVVANTVKAIIHPVVQQVTKMIYQDGLADGWQNWSWATVNTVSAAPVRRGSSAISVTAGGWSALYLRRMDMQSTSGYSALTFWIHGGETGGQTLQVIALRSGNLQTSKPIPAPVAGTWTRVVIPLSDLGLSEVLDFNGLWIQNASGSTLPTFHVDDIALVGTADAGDWFALDWDSWRQSEFSAAELAVDSISGPNADPDHDGWPNRVEWYLLGNPHEHDGGPWCSWQIAGGAVAFTYDRRAGFPSAMTLEVSTDLKDWQPAVGVSQVFPLDASGLKERVSWSIPTTEPSLFLRLK